MRASGEGRAGDAREHPAHLLTHPDQLRFSSSSLAHSTRAGDISSAGPACLPTRSPLRLPTLSVTQGPMSQDSRSPNVSSDDEEFVYPENESDAGPGSSENGDDVELNHTGNYSQRMDEIFSDEEFEVGGTSNTRARNFPGAENHDAISDDNDDEGFLYTGKDAEPEAVGYRAQLADVLEDDQASSSGYGDEELSQNNSLQLVTSPQGSHVESNHVWPFFVLTMQSLFNNMLINRPKAQAREALSPLQLYPKWSSTKTSYFRQMKKNGQ